jgi:hypothetical protein
MIFQGSTLEAPHKGTIIVFLSNAGWKEEGDGAWSELALPLNSYQLEPAPQSPRIDLLQTQTTNGILAINSESNNNVLFFAKKGDTQIEMFKTPRTTWEKKVLNTIKRLT